MAQEPRHSIGLSAWVETFRALSDPVRLDLFSRITEVEEMSCTQLVADAHVSASTVSYHVRAMKNAGLVDVRKQGRNYFYTARRAAMIDLASTSALRPPRRCAVARPSAPESRRHRTRGRTPDSTPRYFDDGANIGIWSRHRRPLRKIAPRPAEGAENRR